MAQVHSSEPLATDDEKRKAVARYFDLRSSLIHLSNPANHTEQARAALAAQSARAKVDINVIGNFLSSYIEPIYYNERRKRNSTQAVKVLQQWELLEMILEPLAFIDVLHMSETCRTIRKIIYESPKLQVQLFLKPAEQQDGTRYDLISPLMSYGKTRQYYFGGFMVEFDMGGNDDDLISDSEIDDEPDSISPNESVYIRFWKCGPDHYLSRIGKNWKKMIISQPSFKYIEVGPECDCFAADKTTSQTVTADSGFTLGDLLVEARKAFKRGCVWCKLDAASEQLYDGWEYAMTINEMEDKLEPQGEVESVLVEAYLREP